MITLHNGCWMSDPTVNPSNWLTQNASVKKDWYVQFYFHDPEYKDKPILRNGKLQTFPNGLLVIFKGMNHCTNLVDRRILTASLIEGRIKLLKEKGLNPITGQSFVPFDSNDEISPTTPFIKALHAALEKFDTSKENKYDITSCLNYVIPAIEQLRLTHLEIQKVSRKHIYLILEQCKKNKKGKWSNQTYNHYRSYLMMLFKVLRKLEAIELNPIKEIDTKEITRKLRDTLSEAQIIQIHEYLTDKDPDLLRYIHIFFLSGARSAELFRVQGKHVNLDTQYYKILLLKGKGPSREEWRPIVDSALDLWKEQMQNCGPDDYVFSRGCRPYKNPVLKGYITKKWREQIKWPKEKGGLGINVDFYALKHLTLDNTAKEEGIEMASALAGHTTGKVTHMYAQGEKHRQFEKLKKTVKKFI